MDQNDRTIALKPVDMGGEVMEMLERKGCILRLRPGRHALPMEPGNGGSVCLYASDPKYGQHKLLGITMNRTLLPNFGTHPDNEEFLLIGENDAKPMFLIVALCDKSELDEKIRTASLRAEDFVALRVRYNDPEVSFFTMLKDIPHGECVAEGDGKPATFYVTEPTGMGVERTDFRGYSLKVL